MFLHQIVLTAKEPCSGTVVQSPQHCCDNKNVLVMSVYRSVELPAALTANASVRRASALSSCGGCVEAYRPAMLCKAAPTLMSSLPKLCFILSTLCSINNFVDSFHLWSPHDCWELRVSPITLNLNHRRRRRRNMVTLSRLTLHESQSYCSDISQMRMSVKTLWGMYGSHNKQQKLMFA